jgi:hypothetical protein
MLAAFWRLSEIIHAITDGREHFPLRRSGAEAVNQ